MRQRPLGALVALAVALGGCGLKGPLYMPEKPGEVVVRPTPAASDPEGSSPPSAPETQPPPEQLQDPPDGTDRG